VICIKTLIKNQKTMLQIKKSVIEIIKAIAKEELPNEACGYLAGKNGVISKCYRLTNTDQSPEHFSFDPNEQFDTLKDARTNGLEIIANFHSHPASPARPSVEDIRLAYDPNILYGIVSLQHQDEVLKFFRIIKKEVNQVNYSVI